MKRTKNNIQLKRENLRVLSADDVQDVVGGTISLVGSGCPPKASGARSCNQN